MPDSIHSPLDRVSAPFDPKDLRKSTIAIPLWNAIEQELAQTEGFLKQFPEVLKDHNAAVFHRKQFPGGLDESRRVALERLREAVAELKETTSQTIDPYDPATRLPEEVSLAKLDGRVIRELLAIDRGETESAIERIWPSLFDVTIDINLDFKPTAEEMQQHETSDSRIVAQARIKEFIDQAKKEVGVIDEDQCVDEKAMKLIPQYVFARLEGKVIKKLVAIDQAVAATEAEADELIKRRKFALIDRFLKIHHIWPDFKLRSCITKTIATVKADAAHRSFHQLDELEYLFRNEAEGRHCRQEWSWSAYRSIVGSGAAHSSRGTQFWRTSCDGRGGELHDEKTAEHVTSSGCIFTKWLLQSEARIFPNSYLQSAHFGTDSGDKH